MLMKPKSTSNLSCGKKRIKHIKAPRLVDPGSNNIVERLNGTFRERNKTMRSFIGGFRIYYNFLRSHLALNGKTPAEAAKIRLPRGKNRWLTMMKISAEQSRKKGNPAKHEELTQRSRESVTESNLRFGAGSGIRTHEPLRDRSSAVQVQPQSCASKQAYQPCSLTWLGNPRLQDRF